MEPLQGLYDGAGNTFLKLFSSPEVRSRVTRIKEMLAEEDSLSSEISNSH